jgi:hypothetical protein
LYLGMTRAELMRHALSQALVGNLSQRKPIALSVEGGQNGDEAYRSGGTKASS